MPATAPLAPALTKSTATGAPFAPKATNVPSTLLSTSTTRAANPSPSSTVTATTASKSRSRPAAKPSALYSKQWNAAFVCGAKSNQPAMTELTTFRLAVETHPALRLLRLPRTTPLYGNPAISAPPASRRPNHLHACRSIAARNLHTLRLRAAAACTKMTCENASAGTWNAHPSILKRRHEMRLRCRPRTGIGGEEYPYAIENESHELRGSTIRQQLACESTQKAILRNEPPGVWVCDRTRWLSSGGAHYCSPPAWAVCLNVEEALLRKVGCVEAIH